MLNRFHVFLEPSEYRELKREARRQERPISWLLQKAWMLSKDKVAQLPDAYGARSGWRVRKWQG